MSESEAHGEPTLRITAEEGRFDRQERITWWDQAVLRRARVLVVGAGALGNEIVKNLALVGVGNVVVADLDAIELSNLSRTVLFRESDLGRSKAEVAAEAARALFPQLRVQPFTGDVVAGLGLGVFRWADLVLAGLDNREARLAINRACWKVGTPWIDGGIEALDGVMRLFAPPDGACYECTMSAVDWRNLEARRSCALLTRDELQGGKVPTTATVSSIIAGLQCHEAVKWLHGRSDLAGRGLIFQGTTLEFYPVSYPRKDECYSHVTWPEPEPLGRGVGDVRLGDLLDLARARLGPAAVVELNHDLIEALECPKCGVAEPVFAAVGRVSERQARCPGCGVTRAPRLLSTIDGDTAPALLGLTAGAIGVPPYDILALATPEAVTTVLFDADAPPRWEAWPMATDTPPRAGPAADEPVGASVGPDALRLDEAGIEAEPRPFPGREAEFRVVLETDAHRAILDHARTRPDVELCGVLVGDLHRDGNGPYLVITDIIAGRDARQGDTSVTFTHSTWDRIHREMDARHAGRRIVGWYHTHPGFGVFLSEVDLFAHRNFFDAAYQVALVVDPKADQVGLFCWQSGSIVRARRFWIGDEPRWDADRLAVTAAPGSVARGSFEPRPARGRSAEGDRSERDGAEPWWAAVLLPAALAAACLYLAYANLTADLRNAQLGAEVVALRRQVGAENAALARDLAFRLRDRLDRGEPPLAGMKAAFDEVARLDPDRRATFAQLLPELAPPPRAEREPAKPEPKSPAPGR